MARMLVKHYGPIMRISHTSAPSTLKVKCGNPTTVPVLPDTKLWRATVDPTKVTCKNCLKVMGK